MIRRFAVGAARAAACAQNAPYTSGNVQGAGKVYAIACSGVRSAAARYAGFHAQATLREKEFKNVDYSPDLKGTDFDGPVDLDRPQNRTVGSPRVQALADDIVNLTLLEVNDLMEILTERLNLPPPTGMPMGGFMGVGGMPPAPNMAGAAGPGRGAAAEESKEEKSEFDLKLESFDSAAKIKVIKEIRALTALGLKEAKELVEGAPCVIKKHLSKADAEAAIEKLKAIGAVCVMA